MSVFEKHNEFIMVLQEGIISEKEKPKKEKITVTDIQAELERKFDELFGPLDEDD